MKNRGADAFVKQDGTVEQRASHVRGVGSGDPDKHGRRVRQLGRHESSIHEEIARKIPHQRQFGGYHQVRASSLCFPGCANDQQGTPRQISGRGN
jgi:hypothetical protein